MDTPTTFRPPTAAITDCQAHKDVNPDAEVVVIKAASGERLTFEEVSDLPPISAAVQDWRQKVINKFALILPVQEPGEAADLGITFRLEKLDDSNHLAFGWASVSSMNGEDVIDKQGDIIPEDELEAAAYEYVLMSREGDQMHEKRQVATLVESCVFTLEKQKTMGIDMGRVGWWIGFYVEDDSTWDQVKKGDLQEFSIEATAERHEVAV